MYCRTCGSLMNDNAEICVKCGVRKNIDTEYCQACGGKTHFNMEYCETCGAKLIRNMSPAEIKYNAVSKGRNIIGNILLIPGIIILIAMVINILLGFSDMNSGYGYISYSAVSSFSAAGNCALIGGILTGIGISLKRKN